MSTELIAFGVIALALGGGLLYVGRYFYPRLELADDALSSVRLLTAIIAGVLILMGLGLIAVGVLR